MSRRNWPGAPSLPADRDLLQMLLTDYSQAVDTLDRAATALRFRESRLRDALARAWAPSSSPGGLAPAPVTGPAQTSGVAFFCLGKFKVEVQGVALDLQPPAKALKILKLLVHRQGHPSPREALAEALWPESDPEVAFNRLRVAIHSLRQALVKWANLKDVVVYHGGVYGLNPQLDLWVDADEFEQRWRQGVRLDASGLPREAMVSYRQAELVYQGDYLEDDPYEEWTFLRRERLRDAYLHLLGKLAAGYFEEPDYGSCIACCHKILAEDPYREDTYRQLMGCYAAMGQKAVALHWYQVCHATLRKGLDVEPSIQTSRLSQQILSDPA